MPPKKAALEQIANARKEVEQVWWSYGVLFYSPGKEFNGKITPILAEAGAECAEKTDVRDAGWDGEVCFGQSRGN